MRRSRSKGGHHAAAARLLSVVLGEKEPGQLGRALREKTEVATHVELRIGTPKGPRWPGGAQAHVPHREQNGEILAGAVCGSRPGKRLAARPLVATGPQCPGP